MLDILRLQNLLATGNASLLLVKGAHPKGDLPKVYVHIKRTRYCQDTGKPSEARDIVDLSDMARAAQEAGETLKTAEAVVAAWKEILTSAVKAEREGDFSKDLKDKDVKAVIEAAQKAA
jgi:hypothetical protein